MGRGACRAKVYYANTGMVSKYKLYRTHWAKWTNNTHANTYTHTLIILAEDLSPATSAIHTHTRAQTHAGTNLCACMHAERQSLKL